MWSKKEKNGENKNNQKKEVKLSKRIWFRKEATMLANSINRRIYILTCCLT